MDGEDLGSIVEIQIFMSTLPDLDKKIIRALGEDRESLPCPVDGVELHRCIEPLMERLSSAATWLKNEEVKSAKLDSEDYLE